MKLNTLDQFVRLRTTLETERADLLERLTRINAALGQESAPFSARALDNGVIKQPATRGRRPRNSISLKGAIIKVTSAKPLTRPEILAAVRKLGYHFATKDPMNSVNALLYGKNPKFKRVDGKFSLPAPKTSSRMRTPAGGKTVKRKRRMSAAGRARISAAAKARWAKVKAAGGKSL